MPTEITLPPAELVMWRTGTPPVPEGQRELYWCAVKVGPNKLGHCFLDFLNRHVMPAGDGLEPARSAEPVPNSDDEYYWTGWHEQACESCDTQWTYSGEVVAWMALPRLTA